MHPKEPNLDLREIRAQITELKTQLERIKDPGEAHQLRQRLHRLQIEQLLALDKMEWYVEMDGLGLFDKC